MYKNFGRLGGVAALTAVAALASSPLLARQGPEPEVHIVDPNSEDSLLGIRLTFSTFRDVLKKYGQPTEIQAGGPYSPTPPPGAAGNGADAAGGGKGMGPGGPGGPMGPMGMGGGRGMSSKGMSGPGSAGGAAGGGAAGGGAGSRQTSKNGFPGSNGGGAGGGGAAGAGPMGGGPMMGAGSGGPGRGQGKGGDGGGPGLPGFGPGGPGGPGGDGSEGDTPGTGTEEDPTGPLKETTWWYHDHLKGMHMAFVFNRNGQVIQIGEYGPRKMEKFNKVAVPNGGATRKGVALGGSLGTVIGKYGFSLDGAHDAENVIMRFGHGPKIAFQMVNNAVLGITVGVTK